MHNLSNIPAVILAGGFGTRLRTVVTDRPKVIADINGRPFLEYLLDQLVEYGLNRIILSTGYLGKQIEARLGTAYKNLKIEYSHEPQPLGTGGALRLAVSKITTSPLLVLNGDSFCQLNLDDFLSFHMKNKASISIAVTKVQDISRYGAVVLTDKQQISHFEEKGVRSGEGFINAGIYLMNREVLLSIPPFINISLEKEVFSPNTGLYGFVTQGHFIDIGIPADYLSAQSFFLKN